MPRVGDKTQIQHPIPRNAILYLPVPTGENQFGDGHITLRQLEEHIKSIGAWDMTGTISHAAPATGADFNGASAEVDEHNYTFTAEGPLPNFSGMYPCGTHSDIILPDGTGYARVRIPNTTDSNVGGVGIWIAQQGDTFGDVFTILSGNAEKGDYAAFLQWVGGSLQVIFAVGEQVNTVVITDVVPTFDIPEAGEDLLFGINFSTGALMVGSTGTAPVQAAIWDLTGNQRELVVGFAGLFTGETPSFPNGPFNFDLGDSTGGRDPFTFQEDADLPEGALNGDRFRVTAPGRYNGVKTLLDDVVELYDNTSKIAVMRAIDMMNYVAKTELDGLVKQSLPGPIDTFYRMPLLAAISPISEFDTGESLDAETPAGTARVVLTGVAGHATETFERGTLALHVGDGQWVRILAGAGARVFARDTDPYSIIPFVFMGIEFVDNGIDNATPNSMGLAGWIADRQRRQDTIRNITVDASGSVELRSAAKIHEITMSGAVNITGWTIYGSSGSAYEGVVRVNNGGNGTNTVTISVPGWDDVILENGSGSIWLYIISSPAGMQVIPLSELSGMIADLRARVDALENP